MKKQNKMMRKTLIVLASVFIGISCMAVWPPNSVWGNITNEVYVGMDITTNNLGLGHPPLCILYIKTTSTNEIHLRFPRTPTRFDRIELYGPDGQAINLKQGITISDFDGVIRTYVSGNKIAEVDHFSISDTFDIKTNGQYQLVISLMATTNIWWKPPMRVEVAPDGRYTNVPLPTTNTPIYFIFPPVTNTFSISTNDIRR